jgi:hypothetical protein
LRCEVRGHRRGTVRANAQTGVAGRVDGTIGSVAVFNVAVPMKREFWVA